MCVSLKWKIESFLIEAFDFRFSTVYRMPIHKRFIMYRYAVHKDTITIKSNVHVYIYVYPLCQSQTNAGTKEVS